MAIVGLMHGGLRSLMQRMQSALPSSYLLVNLNTIHQFKLHLQSASTQVPYLEDGEVEHHLGRHLPGGKGPEDSVRSRRCSTVDYA